MDLLLDNMIKKWLQRWRIITVMLMLTSCDRYLETPQYGDVLPESVEDYATLIYKQLQSIEGTDQLLVGSFRTSAETESYTDNLNASLATTFDLSVYVGADLPKLQYRFANIYGNIKDFNIVLDEITSPQEDLEKKLAATARSLRALSYFNLMREFCVPYLPATADSDNGLPLVSTFDLEYLPARSSLKETADFIISDLQIALNIGQKDELYKFTDMVNHAYLARVCHWTQRWEEAASAAETVLAQYPLTERGDFGTQALSGMGEKSGSIILRSYTNGSANSINTFKRRLKSRPVHLDFLKLFTEADRDIRYQIYFDDNLTNEKSPQGWIRAEEMALIAAEAYAHLGNIDKSLHWLNMLRSKRISAYTAYTADNLPETTAGLITEDCTGSPLTPLMDAILQERRKELYMEGDRWFELKRNGRPEFWVGFNGVKYETKKFLYTYPIHRSETILNPNIEQNEGYENL